MKTLMKLLALMIAVTMLPVFGAFAQTVPGTPENIPENLQIDWNARYSFEELEAQMKAIVANNPEIATMYPIGRSWQERNLWCVELTNPAIAKEDKTGIAVMANIHGGERESASCAMYFLWWAALNAENDYVAKLLDDYVLYVVPVINPDGYVQSDVINTRQNLRPRDLNGDGVPFSDPYTDLNGDGYISYLFAGNARSEEHTSNSSHTS